MLNCQQASQLASEGLDHTLPFRKRMALRMHLFLCNCPVCQGYSRQMQAFRQALLAYRQALTQQEQTAGKQLDEAARERILQAVRQEREQMAGD